MTGAKYRKVEEKVVPTYSEASQLADLMFAPYGEKDAKGSRTAPEAKVRIRLRKRQDRARQCFRVILYKSIALDPSTKVADGKVSRSRKRRPRHRNDRKGTTRGRRQESAS